jgi:Fe-S cluster biogenesis protein NfuA/nitrite reductase/ring-hydroxylating ferredoxin subunit
MNRELHERSSHVEAVLDEFRAAGDERATERAEELVRALMGLYAVGLGRVVDLARESALLGRLAEDEVTASLLVLHDLHPDDASTRIQAALDRVRPYLGSHAGGVELTGVDELGVAHLTLEGSCNGCPSSTVTVSSTLERAVLEAAPEVVAVDVTGVVAPTPAQPLLQIGLRPGLEPRVPADAEADPVWAHLESAAAPGTMSVVDIAGESVLLVNLGGTAYAYRDRCPRCGASLAGGALTGDELACPSCHGVYDVRLAGRGLDSSGEHLDPLPLLPEGTGWKVALVPGLAA